MAGNLGDARHHLRAGDAGRRHAGRIQQQVNPRASAWFTLLTRRRVMAHFPRRLYVLVLEREAALTVTWLIGQGDDVADRRKSGA